MHQHFWVTWTRHIGGVRRRIGRIGRMAAAALVGTGTAAACLVGGSGVTYAQTTCASGWTATTNGSLTTCTLTFTPTGHEQSFTVPGGVSALDFFARGGDGAGSNGTEVHAEIPTTPGSTLYVEVGGSASGSTGGFNGGGNGGAASFNGNAGGGGGGASDVRTCSVSATCSPSDSRVIVASGGGGGGGAGGGSGGSGGVDGGKGGNGSGGVNTAGGQGGIGAGEVTANGGTGGAGGSCSFFCTVGAGGGGGGGGGYLGGQGGQGGEGTGNGTGGGGGGGGGGSSWAEPSALQFVDEGATSTGSPNVQASYTFVTQTATTTTLSSSPNPSVVGQQVTYTATVTPAPGGGSVSFAQDNSTIGVCGSQALNGGGQATCTVTYTGTGTHTISASYGGDTNFSGSTSGNVSQVINQASTTTTVASGNNPATLGQAVAFSAIVTVNAPGAGTPTGSVTFKDGSSVLATATLSGDLATSSPISTSSLAQCVNSITAVYNGDSNFSGSTSAALTQYVDTDLSGFPRLPSGAYNLHNVKLAGACLAGANLSGADLSDGTFKGANFTNASLSGANLDNGNFSNANFAGANLSGANLTNANLKGVIWNSTTCPDNTNSNQDGGTCLGHL